MTKTLVIGSSGLVGSRFINLAKDKLNITGIDEKTLDITDKEAVKKYFEENKFDSVVNFAAVTNVDGAEKERGDENGFVWKLNVEGPKNLEEVCRQKNIFFAQISTDFVFEGTKENSGPYDEDAKLPSSLDDKMGWYGWTKNRGEVGDAIVRIAYPFYAANFEGKLDFAKNYLKVYDEGKLFPIFTDQIFTPINVDDLIYPLVKILEEKIKGVFHLVSSDPATPFEFVEYLLKKARNVEGVVQKGSMEEFLKAEGRTPRPRLGGLNTLNTQKTLNMRFKSWREMVDEFVENL